MGVEVVPMSGMLVAGGASPVQAASPEVWLTSVRVEAGPHEMQLILTCSEGKKFYLTEGPEANTTTLILSGVSLAEGVAVPSVDSPLLSRVTLVHNAAEAETRLDLALGDGVSVLPLLSPDNRQLWLRIRPKSNDLFIDPRTGTGVGAVIIDCLP